jgi:hypothetical protein
MSANRTAKIDGPVTFYGIDATADPVDLRIGRSQRK